MLDIVLFALTSLTADLPISPSSDQVRSMAMSNSDGFKPNPLLQQMYGTQVLDEDVDLELSDEELELIAGRWGNKQTCNTGRNQGCTINSDVFVGGNEIISFSSIQQFVERPERHQELINYIRDRFESNHIPVGNEGHPADQIYARIAEHVRATAPILTKREHRGLKIALTGPYAGVECYLDGPCQY